jgi:hypothetical protein
MELKDINIIKEHMDSNEVLKNLYKEHVDLERQLEKFNNKSYLTPADEMERKRIQKLKLLGRDKMENIIQAYRINRA